MNSVALKAALALVGVGGVVGGGFLVKNHISSEYGKSTIKDLIDKSKTKIAVTKDEHWSKLWDQYKKDNENNGVGKDSWKLEEWKGSNNPTTIPDSYKARCTSLSGEKVEGEGDTKYLEFLKMCARDKNVGDLLSGSTLLSKDNGNDTKWKNRFKKYQAAKGSQNSYPIEAITLASGDSQDNAEHLKKLQDGCATQWNKSVTGNEDRSYLEAMKEWCSAEVTKNDQ
ncbi:hypothetical protein MHC_01670 [Mycoplasma haemocanis str. Illinois]|uniref:Uncharacterized protein n=1 Tax=Mycoplasma haemocanis (strain Illinois) TaxID=1111676 RepID=H6N6C8_MYCHN|nr:hypothetical protein [Mycoplasma haemocanis]AEW45200.1 hypothetical protein MHC_01670 [Mycoplasma haemocanis str. Illinois]